MSPFLNYFSNETKNPKRDQDSHAFLSWRLSKRCVDWEHRRRERRAEERGRGEERRGGDRRGERRGRAVIPGVRLTADSCLLRADVELTVIARAFLSYRS